MLEITVASGKGGVGKTTITASILITLASRGYDVIAVDADADAPNLHIALGIDRWDYIEDYSESEVAEIDQDKCIRCGSCMEVCSYKAIYLDDGVYKVNKLICEGCPTCRLVCPVDAIYMVRASTGVIRYTKTRYDFTLISARLEPGRPNSGKLVSREREYARGFAREDSIILIDAAAGIGCQVISSIAGSNATILVAEPTKASFNDLKRVYRVARHFMQPTALVINKYDLNEDMTHRLIKYADENNIYLLGLIPYDDTIPKSISLMKPVILAYPDSKASKALREISEKVVEIIKNWSEWYIKYRPKKPHPYKPIIIKPK